jgi:ABC-type uncharacterized transport system substrate-binding protein
MHNPLNLQSWRCPTLRWRGRAERRTSTISIVAVVYDEDPVSSGLIRSFHQPGGNITGISQRQLEIVGKRLELLKEALPGLSHVAVFWDSFGTRELAELHPAAHALGIKLDLIELKAPYDFQAAYRTAKQNKAGAVILMFSSVFYAERARIGALGLKNGISVMGQLRDTTVAGGLCRTDTSLVTAGIDLRIWSIVCWRTLRQPTYPSSKCPRSGWQSISEPQKR